MKVVRLNLWQNAVFDRSVWRFSNRKVKDRVIYIFILPILWSKPVIALHYCITLCSIADTLYTYVYVHTTNASLSLSFLRRPPCRACPGRVHLPGEHLRGRRRLLRLQDRGAAACKENHVEVQRESGTHTACPPKKETLIIASFLPHLNANFCFLPIFVSLKAILNFGVQKSNFRFATS